jgi:hypothetical protein
MNREVFFDAIRKPLFRGVLTVEQVAGTEAKLDAFHKAGWPLAWAAYGLATSYHETAHTMQPVAEYGRGRGKKYGIKAGPHGHVYYGRGDVQLTWLANYERAGKALGINLVKYPDLALDPAVSARIMIDGMGQGWFTGRANRHYLNGPTPDYIGARRIINGTDRAQLIAGYARTFEAALRKAGYDSKPDAPSAELVPQAPDDGTNPPGTLPTGRNPLTPQRQPLSFWQRFRNALKGSRS